MNQQRYLNTIIDRPEYMKLTLSTPELGTSAALSPAGKKQIQQVICSLLYYSRAADPTILGAISALASHQWNTMEDTNTKLLQLLNYCASHLDSNIRYTASDMILNIHSDAGYLNESEARSRAGGRFFMSSQPKKWRATAQRSITYLVDNSPHSDG
jgi:hypothetical protein